MERDAGAPRLRRRLEPLPAAWGRRLAQGLRLLTAQVLWLLMAVRAVKACRQSGNPASTSRVAAAELDGGMRYYGFITDLGERAQLV